MKSILPAIAIATGSLLGLASFGAHAADGTITFTGTVSDTTCSINGSATGNPANVAVTLPTVSAGSLKAAGSVAGTSTPTDMALALSGCSGTATKAIASFENGPTVDQTSGYLNNQATTGAATNVQVRLLNASLQPINITTNSNNDIATNGSTIAAGAANMKYFAQYYSTGAATAGAVNTSVQYTMQYQ
ncbi:major type 1 subunit fimbrin (pilin) [Paraburkholderia sp. GAS199]|uniref:fimbrial protein n=1 Tax=Paraburkholderia sp. GAS199 TaxID=3035126 RepID=UPI003D23ED42